MAALGTDSASRTPTQGFEAKSIGSDNEYAFTSRVQSPNGMPGVTCSLSVGDHSIANAASIFVAEHGMLPLVRELRLGTGSTRTIFSLLKLLTVLLSTGNRVVCETACLLGAIPTVLPFVETHQPQQTRLLAATFTHTLCVHSPLTLQMLMGCQGVPALVRLLLNPSAPSAHPIVCLAIDSIKSVLDMRWGVGMKGRSPRNDLCRMFVELEVLELLISALLEINTPHPAHADRAAEIFLLFSSADTVVKAKMATRKVNSLQRRLVLHLPWTCLARAVDNLTLPGIP